MKLPSLGFALDGRPKITLAVLAMLLCVLAVIVLPQGATRLAVALIISLPVLFIAIDRPELVFYLLVIILFSNLDVLTGIRIYRLILAFLVFALALKVLDGLKLTWHHPTLLALGAFFGILVIQSVSVARDVNAAIVQMVEFVKVLFVVAIAWQFVRDRIQFKRFLLVMGLGIGFTAAAPLVFSPPKRHVTLSLLWEQGVFRYEGLIFEPNLFAMMILMLLPMLFFFLGLKRRSPVAFALIAVAILGSLGALVLTFSRGGFVGLAILVLTLVLVERRNPWILVACCVIIVATVAISPSVYWQRILSVGAFFKGERLDLSIEVRIEAMKEAIRIGLEHPFLGVGVDNSSYTLGSALAYRIIVHNAFLQVFAELGAIGLAFFCAIIVYNYLLIRRLMKSFDPEVSLLGRMLLVQIIAVLANAFFIPVAYDFFLWFLFALPAMADYSYRDRHFGADRISS